MRNYTIIKWLLKNIFNLQLNNDNSSYERESEILEKNALIR